MNKREIVRCINTKTNQVKGFARYICDGETAESRSWQNATGFYPQELPELITPTKEVNSETSHEDFIGGLKVEAEISEPKFSEHETPVPRRRGRPNKINT